MSSCTGEHPRTYSTICPKCKQKLAIVYLCAECWSHFAENSIVYNLWNKCCDAKNYALAYKVIDMWANGEFNK